MQIDIGGGGGRTPLEFLICYSIYKRFCLQWKVFDLLYKMRYILWVVALLGACDVTNNGRFCLQWKVFDLLYKMRYILWVVALLGACDVTNNGRLLGFYKELEIRLKPLEMVIFRA